MANVSNNDVRSVIHGLKNSSSGWDGLSAYRTQNSELRTQNFIQHNYEDLSTNIKNINYKWYVKQSKCKSPWIISWRLI